MNPLESIESANWLSCLMATVVRRETGINCAFWVAAFAAIGFNSYLAAFSATGKMPVPLDRNLIVGWVSATGKMPVPLDRNLIVGWVSATGKMPVPLDRNLIGGSRGWASCPPLKGRSTEVNALRKVLLAQGCGNL